MITNECNFVVQVLPSNCKISLVGNLGQATFHEVLHYIHNS